MSKQPRRSARIDQNQKEIVDKLRKVDGVSVLLDMDDILVGFNGHNLLYEIKDPATTTTKDGRLKSTALKRSQIDLLRGWKGHYKVVFTFEEIMEDLNEIGVLPC